MKRNSEQSAYVYTYSKVAVSRTRYVHVYVLDKRPPARLDRGRLTYVAP